MRGLGPSLAALCVLAALAAGPASAQRRGQIDEPRKPQERKQLPSSQKGELRGPVAPAIDTVRIQSPTGLWKKTYDRHVEVFLSWAPGSDPDSMRVSEHRDFRDADWQPARERFHFTLSAGSGKKTVHVQLRREQTGPTGLTTSQTSTVRAGSTEYEDPIETAQAEVKRLGCLWDLEEQSGAVVALVRCPLAELIDNVEGLDGIGVSLEKVPNRRIRLEVSGTVEGQAIDERKTLEPVEIAGAVRVATRSLDTRSTRVSAEGDVVKLRLDFESGGTEIATSLRQKNSFCDACVPDLEWDDATLTLNLRLGGSADHVAVEEIFVSDLGGDWDLAGKPGGAAEKALQAVGIGGFAALRDQVSGQVSTRVASELNQVLEARRADLAQALLSPLREALADVEGDPTVGYLPYNHSFLIEVPL